MSSTTKFEQMFMSLSTSDREKVIQSMLETMSESKTSAPIPRTPSPDLSKPVKRELDSPDTPFKGKHRKVCHINCLNYI
jgi:hypothetical protein